MTRELDLGEFVSDSLAAAREAGQRLTAVAIAEAYLDYVPPREGEDFDAAVRRLLPDVRYYLA